MQKETYMDIVAERDDEMVYYSDHIYEIRDDFDEEAFPEIWNFGFKEELAEYKKLDDLIMFIYELVNEECSEEFDTVRAIFCNYDGGIFGLSIKFGYNPDLGEFEYLIFDWRDGEFLFKFCEVF